MITPYNKEQLPILSQGFADWALIRCVTNCYFDNHYPDNKLCQFFKTHPVVFPKIVSSYPLDCAQLVFTDGSFKGRAAIILGE